MHAKPERVKRRRLARRVKAVASVAVAVAAGVFLACQRGAQNVDKLVDAARGDAEGDRAAPGDAAKPDALVERAQVRDAAVDVREHRKGMPVPDNLLE